MSESAFFALQRFRIARLASGVSTRRRPLMELAARSETYACRVSPISVLRSRFTVSFRTGLAGFRAKHRRVVIYASRIEPLSEFRPPSECYTRETSSCSCERRAPLLSFRALQHMRIAESTTAGRYLPSGSAFRVWLPS
jgi:hypothetical protein